MDEEKLTELVTELPAALIETKQKLDEQVNRLAELFKTQPISRRHRRAQRFGHSRLYG